MTSYNEIFKRFSNKITDIKILELSDEDVLEMMKQWMTSAISKFPKYNESLLERDDELSTFNSDLLDIEKEIIAELMVAEWLEPQLNSTLLTSQFYGSKEEKFYAQSNQLEKLQSLYNTTLNNAKKRYRDYEYYKYLYDNLS